MKKVSLIAFCAALGIGVFTGSILNNKRVIKAEAASHPANFDSYTYSGNYYSGITSTNEGLNGGLRKQLTSKILPEAWYSYSGSGASTLSSILQSADEDPTNSSNMIYFYTRDSVKKNAANSWNREHVWPQSLSNNCWGQGKAGADILHIRPTYNTTNSTRGNDKYGDVTGGTERVYNGITYGWSKSGTFMPLDSVKGDAARDIMYVWTAYAEYYSSLPEITNVFSSYDTMMLWHINDAPDVMEGKRNDVSESSKQKNRNPFVDHPEYAWMIYGEKCSSSVLAKAKAKYPASGYTPTPTVPVTPTPTTPVETDLTISESSKNLVVGESFSLTATASNNSYISWYSEDTDVASISSYGSQSGSGITVTAEGVGTTKITAFANISGVSLEKSCTVTVNESPVIITDGQWELTTSVSNGDKVVMANKENNVVAGEMGATFLQSASCTFSSDGTLISELPDNATQFTLVSSEDGYELLTSDGKLGCTAVKKINLSGEGETKWNISFDGNNAIIASNNSEYGSFLYNTSSPRFTTYAAAFSGAKSVQLYKLNESTPTPTPTEPAPTLELSIYNLLIYENGTGNVTATSSNGEQIKWQIADGSIASINSNVSESGESITVTGIKVGKTVLTASIEYQGKDITKTCVIDVHENIVPIPTPTPVDPTPTIPVTPTPTPTVPVTPTPTVPVTPTPTPIEPTPTIPVEPSHEIAVSESSIEVELYDTYSVSAKNEALDNINWRIEDEEIAMLSAYESISNEDIDVIGLKIGKTHLIAYVNYGGETYEARILVEVVKSYAPTPTPTPTSVEPTPSVPSTPTPLPPINPTVSPTPVEPSVPSTPTPVEPITPTPSGSSRFGCGGSIVATSIMVSTLSLVGLCLIIIKKKNK